MNAKEEFVNHYELEDKNLAELFNGAQLRHSPYWDEKEWNTFQKDEYSDFLNYLETINYDPSYGSQEFFGFILFNNNSWMERHEYNGSERWVVRKMPTINPNINEEEREW